MLTSRGGSRSISCDQMVNLGSRTPIERAKRLLAAPTVQSIGTAVLGQLFLLVSGTLIARELGVTGRGQLALVLILLQVSCQLGGLGLPAAVSYVLASSGAVTVRPLFALRRLWFASLVGASLIFVLLVNLSVRAGKIHVDSSV